MSILSNVFPIAYNKNGYPYFKYAAVEKEILTPSSVQPKEKIQSAQAKNNTAHAYKPEAKSASVEKTSGRLYLSEILSYGEICFPSSINESSSKLHGAQSYKEILNNLTEESEKFSLFALFMHSESLQKRYSYAHVIDLQKKSEITIQDLINVGLSQEKDFIHNGKLIIPLNENLSFIKKNCIQKDIEYLLIKGLHSRLHFQHFINIHDNFIAQGFVQIYQQSMGIENKDEAVQSEEDKNIIKAKENFIKSNIYTMQNLYGIKTANVNEQSRGGHLIDILPEASMPVQNGGGLGGKQAALHVAAALNDVDILEYLLKSQCRIYKNAKNIFGFTPLHIAVMAENSKAVKLLIRHNVNVFELNSHDLAPFHYAFKPDYSSRDIISMLISKLYDLGKLNPSFFENIHLECPFRISRKIDYIFSFIYKGCTKKSIFKLLRGLDRNDHVLLHKNIVKNESKIIELLIKYHDKNLLKELLKIRDKRGDPPLHAALKKCNYEIIEVVIKNLCGMDIADIFNILDRAGDSILHKSIKMGRLEVIQFLLHRPNNIDKLWFGVVSEFLRTKNRSGISYSHAARNLMEQGEDKKISEYLQSTSDEKERPRSEKTTLPYA